MYLTNVKDGKEWTTRLPKQLEMRFCALGLIAEVVVVVCRSMPSCSSVTDSKKSRPSFGCSGPTVTTKDTASVF